MNNLVSQLRTSLAARLLAVFILMSILVMALVFGALARGLSSQWLQDIRPHLFQYLTYVNEDIGSPPSIAQAEALARQLGINVYISGKGINYSSTGIALESEGLRFHNHRKQHHQRKQQIKNVFNGDGESIAFGEHQDRIVLRNTVGEYTVYYELRHTNQNRHRNSIAGKVLLWLLVILGTAYFFLRRLLRPVQDIQIGVGKMGSGELDYRVPVRSHNDLGELAGSINGMAADIEAMLDAKRQLLLAVSHELRSPLTRAKIATEMLETSQNKGRIQEDLDEMEFLINEILESERMKSGHAAIEKSPVDLHALVQSVVQDMQVDSKVTVNCSPDVTVVALDEARIRLLLRNLISNALHHGGEAAAAPNISVAKINGRTLLSVQDNGPGIAAEHLPKLTEPFYRADPSRSRATGGLGIGLYLCRLIAEAHGGELRIRSELGHGVNVQVYLAND